MLYPAGIRNLIDKKHAININNEFISPIESLLSITVFIKYPNRTKRKLLIVDNNIIKNKLNLLNVMMYFSIKFNL